MSTRQFHFTARDHPNDRQKLVERLQDFHREVVRQSNRETMLKVYCQAIACWAQDPNTDLYHVERLCDEIRHASALDSLDDWEEA
ncbi:hypothetical protein GCM10027048_36270 [Hymenobacter coalescens]